MFSQSIARTVALNDYGTVFFSLDGTLTSTFSGYPNKQFGSIYIFSCGDGYCESKVSWPGWTGHELRRLNPEFNTLTIRPLRLAHWKVYRMKQASALCHLESYITVFGITLKFAWSFTQFFIFISRPRQSRGPITKMNFPGLFPARPL